VVAGAPAGSTARGCSRLPRDHPLSTTEDFAEFLAHQPPFDSLPEAERREAAEAAQLLTFRTGAPALVEDGDPSPGLFVVHTGAMNLVHQDQVVDVLEPGECFGHPSLLSGMAPAFTVAAREDSTCLLIPPEPALRVLGHREGAAYVALSLRERLVRAGQTVHALPELSLTRLDALVDREPLLLDAEASLRDAARAMTDGHTSAALVQLGSELGIVTDAELREHGLAAGLSPDDPVRAVAQEEPLLVRADRTVGEALVDLLEAHRRDLCVTDERGRVVGVLGIEHLAGGEHSPFALRHALAHAPDLDALVAAARDGLPRLMISLLSAGLAPLDVSRVLTIQSDAVMMRLIDFAFAKLGQAPVAWAWLALGSAARRELTLASDQDNALAYADGGGPDIDRFFAAFAEYVNEGRSLCGFEEDNAQVLARNPAWRMSASRWREVFQECLEHPDRSHLVRAAVAFDFRHVGGGLDIVPRLVEVIRSARAHPDFVRRLARTATDWPVPLGRRGTLATDKDGRLDLKKGGVLPIVNLARLYAISAGVTVSGTLDRLLAVRDTGSADPEHVDALLEAFTVVSAVRMEHHAAQLRAGRPLDNRVDPGELAPLRRATLRDALREVASQQKQLAVYVPLGI
jgi:CBS domain-containing protein